MRAFALFGAIVCGMAALVGAAENTEAPLSQRLVDHPETVRKAALAELRALPEAERLRLYPEVVAAFGTGVKGWYAVEVLSKIGPEALPAVTQAIGSTDELVRLQALQVLRAWPAKSVATLPLLSAALRDRHSHQWAASGIRELGPAAAPLIPDVVSAIRDKQARGQEQLVRAIGFMGSGGGPAASALVDLLSESWTDDEDHKSLRPAIVEVLPLLQPKAAAVLPGLVRFLGDRWLGDHARSIVKSYGAEAIPYLEAALDDENAHIRAKAAEALEDFESPDARSAISRYEAAEPARLARSAEVEKRRAWEKEEIVAPISPTAACAGEARLVASSEFDLTGHGSLLVTAHTAESWQCRPDVLRIWRREADGYHLVLRSDEDASGARYAFTMTPLEKQRLLQISRVADDAYHFDRFFVVGDDATLTVVTFVPRESGCGSWLPSIGREEYAGLEIRVEGDTVRFGFEAVDLGSRNVQRRDEISWRGTLALTPSSNGTPQLRIATCQFGR